MEQDINQSIIYNWFDKCGIISNIRTQLRQNLVHALKCKDTTLSQSRPKSVKQYVYDLLIAEYLLKMNFAYTLSIFTSEAPFPAYFEQLLSDDDPKSRGKLQNDYLQHTLETLGIDPHDSKGHYILSEYIRKDESLLICILQCLKLFSLQPKNCKNDGIVEQKRDMTFGKDKAIQTDSVDSCERCKHLHQTKKKLMKQKEQFDKTLNDKSEKLKMQAQVAEQQLTLLQEKMEQVQNLMHSLSTKKKQFAEEKRKEEERLHRKNLELIHKEEFLARETNRLEVERSGQKQFEENLQRLQNELQKIKRGLSNDESKANLDTRDTQVQTDFPSFVADWSEKELLQRERQDLNGLIGEQQARINQLTRRAVQLARQLEETQLTKINSNQTSTRVMHSNTFVSEGSSTEDILHDAKLRLKRLEEESLQAERRYQDYILKSTGS